MLLATFFFNHEEITVGFTVNSTVRDNELILGF